MSNTPKGMARTRKYVRYTVVYGILDSGYPICSNGYVLGYPGPPGPTMIDYLKKYKNKNTGLNEWRYPRMHLCHCKQSEFKKQKFVALKKCEFKTTLGLWDKLNFTFKYLILLSLIPGKYNSLVPVNNCPANRNIHLQNLNYVIIFWLQDT